MPDRYDDTWDVMVRWRALRRRFVMATVVRAQGYTPRKESARMLIGPSETWGTIGGGAIENEVIAEARMLLRHGRAAILEKHLTRELGMCCGGEMTLFLEVIEPAPKLVVFGAGYIAKPLAAIAAGCGFDVTVVDERPEWATEERFPAAALHLGAPDEYARAWEATGDEYAVVATHDHALDQRVVQHLLGRPLRFLGMIGSAAKQRKFALRLRSRGFPDQAIARVHVPLGLPIGAETPEEIAVSAMAQMIAVRRGRPAEPGWVPPARITAARAAETPAPPLGAPEGSRALSGKSGA